VGQVLPAAAAVLAVAAVWPAYAHYLDRSAVRPPPTRLVAPEGVQGWQRDTAPLTDWRPRYKGADPSFFEVYRKGDLRVALYLGYYRQQRQGAELVNSQNVMVPQKHPIWEEVGESLRTEAVPVKETLLRSAVQRLLVWDWMQLAGTRTTNPYYAKALLAKNRLLGQPDDGVAIILAAPYEEDRKAAEDALREFLRDMLPAIDAAVRTAADS
jgi:EpsI family protein